MDCRIPGFHVLQNLREFAQIRVHWICDVTISCSVTPFSFCFQSFPASGSFPMSHLFLIRWPKYWSFSISPSNEYSGLVSFRIGWFDLAVQGTLKRLLQYIIQKHQLFSAQPSLWSSSHIYLYMTPGIAIALSIRTFVSKVMALLFNMLSKFLIGEGHGNPLQYSCLENPMDRGVWWATVHGVAKSWTQLKWFSTHAQSFL